MKLFILLFFSSSLFAEEVSIGKRHLLSLRPDLEKIWGNYVFSIENNLAEQKLFNTQIPLPKNTLNFGFEEGLINEDVKLDGGGLFLSKTFPPGQTLISYYFEIKMDDIVNDLEINIPFPLDELSVIWPQNSFNLKDIQLNQEYLSNSKKNAHEKYNVITIEKIESGSNLKIKIVDLPQGRKNFWLIGWIFAGMCFLLVVINFIKLKTKS